MTLLAFQIQPTDLHGSEIHHLASALGSLGSRYFVYVLTFISPSAQKTVSVDVPTDLIRGDVYYWGALMAGALVATIPVAFLYSLFLDRFISGLTAGAFR